jgi:hypothetical protein
MRDERVIGRESYSLGPGAKTLGPRPISGSDVMIVGAPTEADATINFSVVMQAADLPESPLAAAAALSWSVMLASRLVHAAMATSKASQRICIDPGTLSRLPIGLYLQVLDCRFSLRGSHLLFKTFFGFAECRVTCQRTFGAGKTNPRNKD